MASMKNTKKHLKSVQVPAGTTKTEMKKDKVVKTETIFSFQKPSGNLSNDHKHEFLYKEF